ncbi:cyclic di-GMP phosphodiesterase [Yersinia enterocolitica]|jgi:cyclic di-GMP phosphodiesterase Gmr|uniref:cyclic-guanylate-specific phosphodiesterase n=2 Tax=Yersinia TaxID=629 RepID=A0AAI8ZPR0_YERFR|nr:MULTISPECIES: cyclic di-GMP phosphodiesterase [Yersinia]HEC1652296.1 cyclic di-GMP phosphodiesterase [Yersinia enterocolitica]ATM88077.1 GGDEF domain-containing protein [Yersinia frederiksenii]AVX40184.1 cyclic di-GMP phosphodiesterase [Yersinia massiliensis]MCB5318957.1 cyclic di-GMP phosphodiesterase [Yersinia massiliensis]MDN0127777.1 cyclic di-GMP phosphodiesterase [Yersinia massiliensis]
MFEDQDTSILNTYFGTHSPFWRLAFDSQALELSAIKGTTIIAIPLNSVQTMKIRSLTGITASLDVEIKIYGHPLHLHLVGRKINDKEWGGTASAYADTESVARDLVVGLSFAEQVVSEANSVIVILDKEGCVQRFNHLSEEYTGKKEQDVIGKNVYDLFMTAKEGASSRKNIEGFFQRGASYEVERWVNTVKGKRLFLFRNKFVHSGSGKNERYLICSGTDITKERRAQERLRILANTDMITGLPNRHAIHERINSAIQTRGETSVGIIYLDLDNFKKVNDHYGHMFGDRLLKDVSLAILGCLGENEMLARLGGDEFIVLVENARMSELETTTQRILNRMKAPFRVGLIEVYTGCSIGIALCPEHGDTLENIIRSADTAMYTAKEHGKRTYSIFSQEMNKKVSEYVWLDTNLRKGLEQHQLQVFYQPKISTQTGKVHSVEALVRWLSPERGLIAPLMFISYAEESGLIGPLGKWVLQTSMQQAVDWKKRGINLRVAVNVSARQLIDEAIVTSFRESLEASNLEYSLVDVELTESCLIDDEDAAINIMKQLRHLGAQVHLDDFGTGYSSLSQLARIPIDAIKLDQSFVRDIDNNPISQSLVRAIIVVAEALKMRVIAEGVETKGEEMFLDSIGIDEKQGFLYAKPMLADELEHWLVTQHPHLLQD